MPTQIFTTMPIIHENLPVGTDFAGGAVPLPSEVHQGETEQP